jgi:hypothetical protein
MHVKLRLKLTQPQLIQHIIDFVSLKIQDNTQTRQDQGTYYTKMLMGIFRKRHWSYQRFKCILNYFYGTRLSPLFAAHQYSRLSSDPLVSHEKAIKRLIRCPMKTVMLMQILHIGRTLKIMKIHSFSISDQALHKHDQKIGDGVRTLIIFNFHFFN